MRKQAQIQPQTREEDARMKMIDKQQSLAIRALIAAELQQAITARHLKQLGVMRSANTLRRILQQRNYRISSLEEALAGAEVDIEIRLTPRPKKIA